MENLEDFRFSRQLLKELKLFRVYMIDRFSDFLKTFSSVDRFLILKTNSFPWKIITLLDQCVKRWGAIYHKYCWLELIWFYHINLVYHIKLSCLVAGQDCCFISSLFSKKLRSRFRNRAAFPFVRRTANLWNRCLVFTGQSWPEPLDLLPQVKKKQISGQGRGGGD